MNRHTFFTTAAAWMRSRLFVLLLLNAVLLAALGAVIWVDNTLNRGIAYTPDPQPIPYANGPHVGVNVYNLHLEPDPAAVTRTLRLARDMGASHIRMQVPWEDIEIHGRGDYMDRRNVEAVGVVSAWDKYDRIVDTANALGLELVMRLDRPPDWARPVAIAAPFYQEGLEKDPTSTGPPDNFMDYGGFVQTVVSRYEGKVRFFQLWNEPNLKNEWNWHTPSPEGFVELLRVGYTAAKAANPDAVILFPGLSPVDGLDERAPMTELEYLDEVYALGGGNYFDIMSAQLYGLGQPPDEHRYVRISVPLRGEWTWRRPLDTRTDVSRVVLLREVMERNGDAQKPIWVGEFGWNSAPESIPEWRRTTWGEPVSEAQKGEYIVGLVERARQEWPWMGTMFIWKLRHGGYQEPHPEDPTPYFSLVQRDWTLLPAYMRLRDYLAQPPTAGVGAHSWQHPAVEDTTEGWRLRFSGQQAALFGGPADSTNTVQATLDGTTVSLEPATIDGHTARVTPELASGTHTLEISAPDTAAPAHFLITREPPLPLWLWAALPALLLGLLLLSGAATMPPLFALAQSILARTPPAQLGWRAWLQTLGGERALLLAMLLGILVFYGFTTDLPTRLVGVAIFGLLACIRPDLALLYVPLTVPLFFLPKGIWDTQFGLPERGIRIPLHEMVLLVVVGATMLRWLIERIRARAAIQTYLAHSIRGWRWQAVVPVALVLLAGTVGVLIALPDGRGAALREWRWLIVEPVLFYALLHYHGSHAPQPAPQAYEQRAGMSPYQGRMLAFFLAGGTMVGLLGILQFGGLNLVPLVGDKVGFSEDQIFVEGVRRVSSVYGHPNNLGLYMGRVWPIALVLALAAYQSRQTGDPAAHTRWSPGSIWLRLARSWRALLLSLCCLLALGGLLVSFSKGALLGAAGAMVVLWLMLRRRAAADADGLSRYILWFPNRMTSSRAARLMAMLASLAMVALVLALAATMIPATGLERFNPLGESSSIRLKLWASSLAMLRDHPVLGVGLDQFLSHYQTYIDPSLIGTNEAFTSHPHMILLNLWLRLGVVGLVAFGWLLVRFFRHVLRQHPPGLLYCGLAAAMTAALLHGLVDNFYFVPDLAFIFWFFLWLADD